MLTFTPTAAPTRTLVCLSTPYLDGGTRFLVHRCIRWGVGERTGRRTGRCGSVEG